ncbi:MAG: hypothetical protein WBM86_16105, partial [Waterburya sp.]
RRPKHMSKEEFDALPKTMMVREVSLRLTRKGWRDQCIIVVLIVYIVIAVLLLSILGIISAEGTLSILAGISGYVLGKEKVKDKLPTEVKPPQNPKEPKPSVFERGYCDHTVGWS